LGKENLILTAINLTFIHEHAKLPDENRINSGGYPMPLFYFVPFDFFKDRKKPKLSEIKGSDIALYGTLGLIVLVLFFALIIVPAMMVVNQTLPPVQVQPPTF
jgi:hypothetical protein